MTHHCTRIMSTGHSTRRESLLEDKMEQKWDDEKEAMLVRLLSHLPPADVLTAIERTSRGTNVHRKLGL